MSNQTTTFSQKDAERLIQARKILKAYAPMVADYLMAAGMFRPPAIIYRPHEHFVGHGQPPIYPLDDEPA